MPRIACIGECMLELRHKTETDLTLAWGGDTFNTAVYLARLLRRRDARIAYVTALGDDLYSDAMLAGWAEEGIDTGMVARLPGLTVAQLDDAAELLWTEHRSDPSAAARRELEDYYSAPVGGGDPAELFLTECARLMRLRDEARKGLLGQGGGAL